MLKSNTNLPSQVWCGWQVCVADVFGMRQVWGADGVSPSSLTMKGTWQVRLVCSSGGRFVRVSLGSQEYEGGETRLVSIPSNAGLHELQEAVGRVSAAAHATSLSTGSLLVRLLSLPLSMHPSHCLRLHCR